MHPESEATAPVADAPASPDETQKKAKKKRAKKARDPEAPRRPSAPRFSLLQWVAQREAATGLPIGLAIQALGEPFASSLRRSLSISEREIVEIDVRVGSATERLAVLQQERTMLIDSRSNAIVKIRTLEETATSIRDAALKASAAELPS